LSSWFSEDAPPEKPYEFSFGDDTTPKLTFNIEIETWFPVADTTREFLKSQSITTFTKNVDFATLSNYSLTSTSGPQITTGYENENIDTDIPIPPGSNSRINI
jgi:hypothetical protein